VQNDTPIKAKKQIKVGVFKKQVQFSIRQLIIFALVFAAIGGYVIYRSSAAQPVVATLEVERMTLPSGDSVVSDSGASGGQAVKVIANGSASGTVNLPSNATSIGLAAKGTKCTGKWPKVNLQVDGKTALYSAGISSSSWKSYTATVALSSGIHTLSIASSNATSCRSLYLDVITFYGPTVVTPIPAVSLSASPTSLTAGSASTLTWNSTNASSCTASGAWSGGEPTSGSVSTGGLNTNSTYNLSCTGSGGTATTSVSITVTSAVSTTKSIYWGSWIDGDTYGGRGDAPWDSTTWDMFESHTAKKVSILHYGQPPMWEQAFAPSTASLVTNRGAIPLMDMSSKSVSLTDIANGAYDSSITNWANAAKTWGKPFFFRWNWEMNGTWFPWGSQAKQNPAAYVAAWKHMHDIVAAQGATNITWVWCPNTIFTGSTPLDQLYPGDNYVDWTCIDGYNKGPLDGDSWKSFSQVFQSTYNQILTVAFSKPIMIGETASNENGGSKAAWITDALQTQLPNNYPKVKAFVWFNWPIYENSVNQQWPIESSSSAQDAFKTGIGSPYYSTNVYGGLPPLTKVQPIQ
jgi:beta-mannanase